MGKIDFKLNYYFEKYKDSCFDSASDFKKRFIKENGKFIYLNELAIMINRYQVKKYKSNLCNAIDLFNSEYCKKLSNIVRNNENNRFGNKEERNRRKKLYEDENM